MRTLKIWLVGLLLAAPAAFALTGNTVASDNVKARLVSEVGAVSPGQVFWVALELDIRDGWHTYWRNPGDSGQATSLTWQLPSGFTAGDIVWTTPHRFEVKPLVNYGYAKHAVHLVQITAPQDLKSGTVAALAAKASWLVCSDVCIPEDANLTLNLPTSTTPGAIDPGAAALFSTARAELPSAQPAATRAKIADDQLIITLGREWGATLGQVQSLRFFPYDEGSIDYAAPQILKRSNDALELSMKIGYQPPKAGTLRGVLLATQQNGTQSDIVPIELAAEFSGAGAGPVKAEPRFAAAPAQAAPVQSVASQEPRRSLAMLMLFAVLGGLILNLMPCVFPVLSIKALSVVEQAQKHPSEVRVKGLVFAAGVVASMLALATVMLALRSGGEQIGWGFQLQSPLFVTFLVYLLLAVGLNLSGVFEVGGGLAGVGDSLTQGDGYGSSFFTGVLATVVATPCSAPFMAPALGAALALPALSALGIFAALGIGISMPYVLLSFAPWIGRALPKPGAWMDTLKQLFAFPVYGTAAWLLWVLAQQTSPFGLGAALGGLILIALAAWAYQKSHFASGGGKVTVLVTAVVAVLLAIILPLKFADSATAAPSAAAANRTANPKDSDEWVPYSAARVAELQAAGRPLLVNFTASWCLTCLVNERNAFADSSVKEIFRNKKVTLMKGDWTNKDAAISQALSSFGRAGVPLYVVYNGRAGSSDPVVLPQLLTAGIVQKAFSDAPQP